MPGSDSSSWCQWDPHRQLASQHQHGHRRAPMQVSHLWSWTCSAGLNGTEMGCRHPQSVGLVPDTHVTSGRLTATPWGQNYGSLCFTDEATKEQRNVSTDPHLHRQKMAGWPSCVSHTGPANSSDIFSVSGSRVWMTHRSGELTPSIPSRPEQLHILLCFVICKLFSEIIIHLRNTGC